MTRIRKNPNPPSHCVLCGRPYMGRMGIQRTCSTSCEIRMRQQVAAKINAAKQRRKERT